MAPSLYQRISRQLAPSTYMTFGEQEDPDDPELFRTGRSGVGDEAIEIGGPWRTLRPAEGPRSGGGRGDHEERKAENDNLGTGDASGAVAWSADLANHGVGGAGDAAVSTTIPELHSEQGALPDRRGGIVGAGG